MAYDDWELISAGSISNPATSASVDQIGTTPTRTWSFTNGEILT